MVPCPPLATALDATATTIALTAVPRLPAKTPPTGPSPQQIIQVGDEIIVCGEPAAGPPWGWNGCQRGAFGTAAATHAAGAEVKGLLQLWGFFLLDPDSTLADEVTSNFAEVVNDADFDMLYFDASDGIQDAQMDRWYYLNKMHLGYYKKLKKDVLYQTSNGTGSDLTWHLVPRSASADGHGDLKGYLDDRLPGMLGMAANYTRSDVGWYYMFKEVRPDQIEYVCAKTIGIDGSISIETSLESMESHPQGRQMLEMIGRYEECRLARFFPASSPPALSRPRVKCARASRSWRRCLGCWRSSTTRTASASLSGSSGGSSRRQQQRRRQQPAPARRPGLAAPRPTGGRRLASSSCPLAVTAQ